MDYAVPQIWSRSSPVYPEILSIVFTGGLSIGAVFGIVIAIVVVLILAFVAVYFLFIKTQGKPSTLW